MVAPQAGRLNTESTEKTQRLTEEGQNETPCLSVKCSVRLCVTTGGTDLETDAYRKCKVKHKVKIVIGLGLLALLLGGGAFMAGRLLGLGKGGLDAGGGPKVGIGSADGSVTQAEWVRAEELPDESPDVSGVFARRQDNSILVDETDGGFVLGRDDDGSLSVTNATGKISEIVVTAETAIYVDVTLDAVDEALASGVLHQQVKPGNVEEIGELSFVRAWGEMHGDRLVAGVLVYNRPPVIGR